MRLLIALPFILLSIEDVVKYDFVVEDRPNNWIHFSRSVHDYCFADLFKWIRSLSLLHNLFSRFLVSFSLWNGCRWFLIVERLAGLCLTWHRWSLLDCIHRIINIKSNYKFNNYYPSNYIKIIYLKDGERIIRLNKIIEIHQ